VQDDRSVDEEVPREHREQRERQDVDPLRRADPIDREAGGERGENQGRPDPRAPGRRAQRSSDRGVRAREPLNRERRAAGDETLERRTRADHLRGGAARPRPVLVAPERAAGFGRFDRAHERDFPGCRFIHGLI
jgi:hypothetical protein